MIRRKFLGLSIGTLSLPFFLRNKMEMNSVNIKSTDYVLILKDFTTVNKLKDADRGKVFGILRDAYKGVSK